MSESSLGWEPAPGHSDDVLYAVDGRLGRIRLNRPQTINATTQDAVDSLIEQLGAWAQDPTVEAVVVDGAGERGLSSGGDIRELAGAVTQGRADEVVAHWRDEYAFHGAIARYPKPYAAWMDGIVMGGGVGLSAHGSLRLVTERTRLAMPETIIGFLPDCGILHLLARSPGETGTHAALTGSSVGGVDAVVLGLADVVVPSAAKEAVLDVLRRDPSAGPEAVAAEVPAPDRASGSWLADNRHWIDECYAGDDAALIMQRLRDHGDPAAREAADELAARSPHSVAITLEALRRAASMTVEEVLAQDLHLARTFATHPDFVEGVRAQVVDKDRNPRWTHPDVGQVSRAEVLRAFD